MSQYRLLRSQKNAIFEALKAANLNHFDFVVEDTNTFFKLLHKESGHYLSITYDLPVWHYGIKYSPGDKKWESEEKVDNWERVFSIIQSWVNYLGRELEHPEFWSQINQETFVLSSSSSSENKLFSDDEKIDIRKKLNQLERFLLENYDLNSENKHFISAKLDKLEQTLESQGRLDWLHTLVGVSFTIIIGIGLAPNQAKEFAQFVGSLLAPIFGGSLPLLP